MRFSALLRANVQYSTGEGVGEINDVVLDANTGRVKSAAVACGGLLRVGTNFRCTFRKS